MVNIAALKAKNAQRWRSMSLDPARMAAFDSVAKRLCQPEAKSVYLRISQATGVPWFVIAVIHEREAGQDFTKQLGQGDPLNKISTHEPKGRGPFLGPNAFFNGAFDALKNCPPYAAKWTDWSSGGTLTLLEEYNGLGYAAMGVPSAYVWSGTNQYVSGKYVADHVYRSNVKDVQEGCAPIILRMMSLDRSVKFQSPSPAMATVAIKTPIKPVAVVNLPKKKQNWFARVLAKVKSFFV